MSGSGISLLDGLTAQMKHLNHRQRVVAENLASSDTPGYRARDVERPDFSKLLGEVSRDSKVARPSVSATSRMAALGSRVSVNSGKVVAVQGTEEKMNGNNVTVEDEILKLGEIRSEHSAATNLYRKSLGLLKLSLGRGGG